MIAARLWQIYDDVATTACAAGDLPLAKRMFAAALDSCGNDLDLITSRIKSIIGLADTAALSKDMQEAERLYLKAVNAIARYSVYCKRGRTWLAHSLARLAHINAESGRDHNAIKQLQRSIRIDEQLYGASHAPLAPKLLELSLLFSRTGNGAAAVQCLARARALREKSGSSTTAELRDE